MNNTTRKIPKIFHQIWLGQSPPAVKRAWINNNHKKLLKEGGWTIMLWGSDTLNSTHFPKTYKYIKKAISMNKPWAMVADIMRYEILYKYGGVYMDVNIEILHKSLTNLINKANKNKKNLIVCHESSNDGLNVSSITQCKNPKMRYYISNGFICSSPMHPALKRATMTSRLENIDWSCEMINEVTGPFYWRESIKKSDEPFVLVLKSNEIYPMKPYESFGETKSGESTDKCIHKSPNINRVAIYLRNSKNKVHTRYLNLPCKKYKTSYTVDHFDIGGTWLPRN